MVFFGFAQLRLRSRRQKEANCCDARNCAECRPPEKCLDPFKEASISIFLCE